MTSPNISYNSWPLGKLPKEFQRPEPEQIKNLGYQWNDPRDIVKIFEKKVAEFAGAKYAVATDCCSHAIFLSLMDFRRQFDKEIGNYTLLPSCVLPKRTYISVPAQVKRAGFKMNFEDIQWSGAYRLAPEIPVWDAAVRWTKGMYQGGYHCVSFQIKQRVPIGRGGMILLDDKESYEYLCRMRYDGRNLDGDYMSDDYKYGIGWHYYMSPEDAARGILLMDQIPEVNEDSGSYLNYSDVSKVLEETYIR